MPPGGSRAVAAILPPKLLRLLRVIHDRVEPTAGPAMSAIPRPRPIFPVPQFRNVPTVDMGISRLADSCHALRREHTVTEALCRSAQASRKSVPLINIGVQSERELHSAMARVQNPTLFSAYFGVPSQALAAAGLIDPFLDVDIPLFVDPVLLEKSSNKTINTTAIDRFRKHFEILVRMLTISKAENDAAWKGARRQLNLSEPPENGLGYGGSGRSGSSRREDIRDAILRTSKEIITLGASDPEMISLMGFFEEDVGPTPSAI